MEANWPWKTSEKSPGNHLCVHKHFCRTLNFLIKVCCKEHVALTCYYSHVPFAIVCFYRTLCFPQSCDLVGLLPAEEAAIRKALRESLRTAAVEKTRDESSSSSSSSSSASSSSSSSSESTPSPSPKEQQSGSKRRPEAISQSYPPAKRMKLKKQKNVNSSVATSNYPAEHPSCQSPAPLSVPSSPLCEHSSPVISESGSLQLMLSSSSDSSSGSSSTCSSHQDSTSKGKRTKKSSNKSLKVKRVLLGEFSTSAGQKSKPLKARGSKSAPKQKRKSEGEIKSGKKNQCTLHEGSKDKSAKGKRKTPGKKEQKKSDNLAIGTGLSSTLTSVNFPYLADDGLTETTCIPGDAGTPARAEERDDSKEERGEEKSEQQKTATFTWYE